MAKGRAVGWQRALVESCRIESYKQPGLKDSCKRVITRSNATRRAGARSRKNDEIDR